ncbi:MAG: hypothetical protein JO356_14510, partial [Acidobacteria bacterium]|nr:hypothetical protein [Acidobacteriota bacterium]
MTEVIVKGGGAAWLVLFLFFCSLAYGQTVGSVTTPPGAESLYLALRAVGLDKERVHKIRGASIDRGALHISLEDGTVAFSADAGGRITGALFTGDGEILITPPTTTERASLALFTGAAILDESFSVAYFRFNDDLYERFKPFFRPPADDGESFIRQWNPTAQNLAEEDALRLLVSFSDQPSEMSTGATGVRDPFLHVYLEGNKLGAFDVRFDSALAEQISAGQHRTEDGQNYYDVWMSFPVGPSSRPRELAEVAESKPDFSITKFKIRAHITPPTQLEANATLTVSPQREGRRVLLLELSRLLQVKAVKADGQAVEFIHNQAIEGSQLARRGNDLIAVILPRPLDRGRTIELSFDYSGAVLSEAANGLLYVGEHGTWYPNHGF